MKTGIYVRIERDKKWVNLDVVDLTNEELKAFFEAKEEAGQSLSNWCVHMVQMLKGAK